MNSKKKKASINLFENVGLLILCMPVFLFLLALDIVSRLGDLAYDVAEKMESLEIRGAVAISIFAWVLLIIIWWSV